MHGTHHTAVVDDHDAHAVWASSSPVTNTPIATGPIASASAFRHKHSHSRGDNQVAPRTVYRRRGSDSTHDNQVDHATRSFERVPTSHARSRTLDHRGERHPLGVSSANSLGDSLGITRPRLDRLLSSDANLSEDARCSKKVDKPARKVREEEKTVIVHQVLPSDSLAGVALKYGVTLTEIRRANKLWSSDTIHLRKVLYIPLDKSAQLKLLMLPTSSEDEGDAALVSLDSADTLKGAPTSPPPNVPSSEIRRVPASQLSFFPPSSRSALPADTVWTSTSRSSSNTSSPSRSNTLPRGFRTSHNTNPTSPFPSSSFFSSTATPINGNGSTPSTLTSLFNALPRVQMSLPRPIAARVSSESARLSSSPAASDTHEHELADFPGFVRKLSLKSSSRSRTPGRDYAPPVPPPAAPSGPGDSAATAAAGGLQRTPSVRTAQPEPSPGMQIPRGPPPASPSGAKGQQAGTHRAAHVSESAVW